VSSRPSPSVVSPKVLLSTSSSSSRRTILLTATSGPFPVTHRCLREIDRSNR
jgi:hypothetical protein